MTDSVTYFRQLRTAAHPLPATRRHKVHLHEAGHFPTPKKD